MQQFTKIRAAPEAGSNGFDAQRIGAGDLEFCGIRVLPANKRENTRKRENKTNLFHLFSRLFAFIRGQILTVVSKASRSGQSCIARLPELKSSPCRSAFRRVLFRRRFLLRPASETADYSAFPSAKSVDCCFFRQSISAARAGADTIRKTNPASCPIPFPRCADNRRSSRAASACRWLFFPSPVSDKPSAASSAKTLRRRYKNAECLKSARLCRRYRCRR